MGPGHTPLVVLYDQLGTGESTRKRDKPMGFFMLALFVAELDNLIRHLHTHRDFDLLGKSWGVTLAIEYIAAHRPQGLIRFYKQHILSLEVWPPEATKTLTQMGEDSTAYRPMYVRSRTWSVIPKLGKVSCPMLITNGAGDEVQDSWHDTAIL